MMVVFAIGAALNYIYNISMGWLLPPDQYGILGVAISFLLILSIFVNSAFPLAVSKFLSEDNPESMKHRVFKSSLIGNVCIALVASFLFYVIYASGVLRLDISFDPFIISIIFALIFSSIGGIYTSALQGMFRFKKYGLLNIAVIITKLVSAVLLVLLGFGALGAFFGLVAGTMIGLLLGVAFISDFKYWKTGGWADRRLYSYALPMFFGLLFMTLLMNLDLLMVKFLSEKALSDTLAGYYRSALILAELPVFLTGALMGAMFPYISRYSSNNSNYSNKTLKYAVLLICPLSIALSVISSSMISLVFPSSYAAAADAMGILALGMSFFVIITVLSGIFQAMHNPKIPAIVLFISVVVDVFALLYLVPRYGILGAAASTTIACGAGMLGLSAAYLRYGFLRFDYLKAIKVVLSLILFGLFIFIFPHGTKLLTLLDLMISGALYIAILFIFGLLNSEDVNMILSGLHLDKEKIWKK